MEYHLDITECPISTEHVGEAIRHLPERKAPGATGRLNEFVRGAPANGRLVRSLVCLYKLAYGWGLVPSSWKVATIHPVPKKGDLSLICNYLPISLTENLAKCVRKNYPRLDIRRWAARNSIQLHISQGGLRERRSALDIVASLQEAIYLRKKQLKRWPVLAFLDIKIAYSYDCY